MRIITGSLKGRRLSVPGHTDVRPTADRVKESVFSAIESRRYIEHCTVLDLYAGSGGLGFETLSRGAKRATFVDQDQKCIRYIEKTANTFGITDRVRTAHIDVLEFLAGPSIPCDIIFADPPYVYDDIAKIPELVFSQTWLAEEGWLILEHSKYHHFTDHPHFFNEKKYGRTFISFFEFQKQAETTK